MSKTYGVLLARAGKNKGASPDRVGEDVQAENIREALLAAEELHPGFSAISAQAKPE